MRHETALLPSTRIWANELSLAVMGLAADLILADMGVEVIKIELKPQGDETRRIIG